MKKIFTLALIFISYFASAQNLEIKEVPSAVKNKFSSVYPSVNDNHWGRVNMDNYETEFINSGVETSVLFDNKGNILETNTAMKISELPNAVNTYVSKNYGWKKINEAERVTDGRGKMSFRVGIGVKELKLFFDYQGNFIRISK